MPLDFRNVNQLWASVLVETLYQLGLRQAILCPGSRSAPLTIAFAQHPGVEAIPVLDERSASFFALGLARHQHLPVALVCTSGTAGANFYPAVIEARESQVPLIILTADRPPELRHCHAGQAIDQVKLFNQYPNWQAELRLPSPKPEALAYLRQTVLFAWEQAIAPSSPHPGPVHLNVPLREPLAPLTDPKVQALESDFDMLRFFRQLTPVATAVLAPRYVPTWPQQNGIIVVGLAQPSDLDDYVDGVAHLAKYLGWPILCDALNPLRNRSKQLPGLICHYDQILRQPNYQTALEPGAVIRLGELPTSKVLRQWLAQLRCEQWIISNRPGNFDPLHSSSNHLRCDLTQLVKQLTQHHNSQRSSQAANQQISTYRDHWLQLEQQTATTIDRAMTALEPLREPKLPWLLSQTLPEGTPLFIANSTPVRDMEWFWKAGERHILPHFNRGANGIDGTLSTALGIAHQNRPTVMLTGDLALLHDTNGWLLSNQLQGHLTIILINNNGGGIFELLPIAQFDPPFEQFFATPQQIDFEQLCATYQANYEKILSWEQLRSRLNPLPNQGIRLLEVCTDRKGDAAWRSQLLQTASGQ